MGSEFNPAVEASKDTIYQARIRREIALWIEYEDIRNWLKRNTPMADNDAYNDYADMVNEAWRQWKNADLAATARFNEVYATLGGV